MLLLGFVIIRKPDQHRKDIIQQESLGPDDVDVDGVCERRPKPLCPHLEITSR